MFTKNSKLSVFIILHVTNIFGILFIYEQILLMNFFKFRIFR